MDQDAAKGGTRAKHGALGPALLAALLLSGCATAVAPEPVVAPTPTSVLPQLMAPEPAPSPTATSTAAPTRVLPTLPPAPAAPAVQPRIPPAGAAMAGTLAGGRKKVLFVGGLDSTSTTVRESFTVLAQTLRAAGYQDSDLLWFSYAGGAVSGARDFAWHPYGCADTRQDLAESTRRLTGFLAVYRQLQPDVEVALVGHSLGGRIALEAAQVAQPRPRVVTLDAPLHPLSDGKLLQMALPWFWRCAKGGPIFGHLVAPRAWPVQQAEKVLTIGSRNDCVYNTGLCFRGLTRSLVDRDESGVQVVPGAQQYWPQVPLVTGGNNVEVSHRAVLSYPAVAERVKQFIGPPR